MPRKLVPQIIGEKYHVFNRGVDKRDTFLDRNDYVRFYMSLDLFNSVEPITNFEQAKAQHRVPAMPQRLVCIEAYALLSNHFHLIVSPFTEGGLAEFMRRVCGGYTNYFNEKNKRSGALFQGTYQRVHIATSEQYQYLFAYVNENHTVHNVVIDREICHTSSLHYQEKIKSRILPVPAVKYALNENIALAKDIWRRRKEMKKSDLLEQQT